MSIWSKVFLGLVIVATLPMAYLAARTLKTHQAWRTVANKTEKDIETLEATNHELAEGDPTAQNHALRPEEVAPIVPTAAAAPAAAPPAAPGAPPAAKAPGAPAPVAPAAAPRPAAPAASSAAIGKPGIRQLKNALYNILFDRGQVWYNVTPGKADPMSGAVVVQVDAPTPHKIQDKTVLQAIEQRPAAQGGSYVGEFRVVGVTDKQVQLEPTWRMSPAELQRLAGSQGPWTLYEIMPIDRQEVFHNLPADQLQALFAGVGAEQLPATIEEYARDGQPSNANDPPERVVDGKYSRALRDYEYLFHDLHKQMALMEDQGVISDQQLAQLKSASDDAKKQIEFHNGEVKDLSAELAVMTQERALAQNFNASVTAEIARLSKEASRLMTDNKQLAGKIAELQLTAAKRINDLTGTPGQ